MADVFLSYKREDQEIARGVAADLEAEGFSVFFDVRIDVGDSWDATIERQLNAAKAVVVLWSPKSRDSQWVRREAREAMARRMLCPAMIARCKVPLEFSDVQAANLIGRRASDRVHAEWRRLCDGVGKCVGRKATGAASPNETTQAPPLPSTSSNASTPYDRRVVLGGGAMVGAALAVGGAFYTWTRAEAAKAERAWNDARGLGTRRAVNAFLRAYPHAPQAPRARTLLATLPLLTREHGILRGHGATINTVTFSPDGARILTASNDRTAKVWDAAEGQVITTLIGHEVNVNSAIFSSDGARILTASSDHTARIWHGRSGRELIRPLTHEHAVSAADFSPDGRLVATAAHDRCHVWDVATGSELAALVGHEIGIMSIAFDPSGARIATSGLDRTARIWDTTNGREIATLQGHSGWLYGATFNPSGTHIVTSSFDRTARVWNVVDEREIVVLRGHQFAVTSASFSADGARIVTASGDSTARLWDSVRGDQLAVITGHEEGLSSAEFSPSGEYVVTASSDHTARIWEIDEEA